MNSRKVLIVEDDPDSQETVATVLQHLNWTVETANDGAQAARFLFEDACRYDIVIIDLALPIKDGWELLEEMLAHPATCNTPCIAVTAYHTSKLREEAIHAGFTAYFPKPIDGTKLGRALDHFV